VLVERSKLRLLTTRSGAFIELEDRWGNTPLVDAERERQDEVCQVLRTAAGAKSEINELFKAIKVLLCLLPWLSKITNLISFVI